MAERTGGTLRKPRPGRPVSHLLPERPTLTAVRQIAACRPWLETEIALVKPRVLVCLGATASQALLGKAFKVSRQRGEFVPSSLAPLVTATVHPSAILRARDGATPREEMARFVRDLQHVAGKL